MKPILYISIFVFLQYSILNAQNVGIGTSAPTAKLDVRGDVSLNDFQLRLRDGADGNHWIGWVGGVVDGAKVVGNSGVVINNTAFNQDVAFFQGDYAYFGFNPGNCCIGFEAAKLGKGRNNDGTLEFMNNGWGRLGGSNGLAFWYNGNADVDDNPQLFLDGAGLDLRNGRYYGYYGFFGGCGNYLALQSDGNMVVYNGGGVSLWASGTSCSDIRTKTNIVSLEEVLPILEQLQVIRFDYKTELNINDKPQIGVIAQEIIKYYPELIYFNEETDRYLVYYDKLSPILLKGIQELSAKINAIEKENSTAEALLKNQETRLKKIESLLNMSASKK